MQINCCYLACLLNNDIMKTFFAAVVCCLLLIPDTSFSQITLRNILSGNKTKNGISENEAGQGIKEALSQGVTNAVLNLNKTDGFFGSEFYKMLLPPDAKKVEKTLRSIGMGGEVDKAILSIN